MKKNFNPIMGTTTISQTAGKSLTVARVLLTTSQCNFTRIINPCLISVKLLALFKNNHNFKY